MVASGLMGYDECQLRVAQNIIMMHIADTTEKKIWIGKSALFVSKQFEENSMHLATDIMHHSD